MIPPESRIGAAIFRGVSEDRFHLRAEIEKSSLCSGLRHIRDRRNLLHQLPVFRFRLAQRRRRESSFFSAIASR